ncbi:MAG TPA: helix-turn-helix domain-containing protein [Blastococcus sp.]|nr:helix-turn-helix domain-containing protein [Blastococcus sp.]
MTDEPNPGAPPEATVDVRDPRALRALAHPLRGALLAALRMDGPSTATRLADRLGESTGSTSYHLRQLATFGFVEEVPGETAGRERWWRARHRSTRWQAEELREDPAGREVVEEMDHRLIAQHRKVLAAHAAEREDLDPAWRAAVSLNDWALHLSPTAARELAGELVAVLGRWQETRQEEGEPLVHVLLDLFPLKEYPL